LPDVFFAILLASAFARPAGLEALLGDGDTGWHIRTGELVLAGGHAPQVDPFSFTRAGAPWFAWEWLSDVVLAGAFRWHGMAAVALLAGIVLSLAWTAVFARLLGRGCGLWVALGATLAAASAASVHYLARPHVFSILFYALALLVLEMDHRERTRRVWLLIPLTMLWANLHAGFVAWLATLGLLMAVRASERDWSRVRRYAALAGGCAAASLANPYGWRLHQHVAQYLSSSWILEHVQEFQSPNIRSEGLVVFAVMLLAAAALSARAERFEAALVLVWGFAALRSARHVPFFALAAAPVLASGGAALWARASAASARNGTVRIFWELGQELAARPRATMWIPLAVLGLAASAPATGFPGSVFPVDAVERNLSLLAPGAAMPRVLTSDQWADYVIFRLYPMQRVFFDGRSDFYGPELGADYRRLMAGERSWRAVMQRYGFEIALLPRDWPLSTALEREPGWRRVYEDRLAVLYERRRGGAGCDSTEDSLGC
jgi:hypothetical protein